jgi:hypothetical protein
MIRNAEQKLDVSSLSENQFINLLSEFQDYLKEKLEPCINEKGVVDYWTCGIDHFDPPPHYDPFKNIMKFCAMKNVDWDELKERLEDYSGISICCECFIVNRIPINEA